MACIGRRELAPPGAIFTDSNDPGAPEMIVVQLGKFWMGSPGDDDEAYADEKPQHEVRIARPFALGRYPMTFAEYDEFCRVTNREPPDDSGWGHEQRPVINVSWEDATAYGRWLSEHTGQEYRLPSEAEWEYACRGRAGRKRPPITCEPGESRSCSCSAIPRIRWIIADRHRSTRATFGSVMSLRYSTPHGYRVPVPARQAYSHPASLGRRYS